MPISGRGVGPGGNPLGRQPTIRKKSRERLRHTRIRPPIIMCVCDRLLCRGNTDLAKAYKTMTQRERERERERVCVKERREERDVNKRVQPSLM